MPPMPKLPSSKDLFVNALKVHQRVYERTHGLIGHRILLGMPALMLRTTGRKSGLTRSPRSELLPKKVDAVTARSGRSSFKASATAPEPVPTSTTAAPAGISLSTISLT